MMVYYINPYITGSRIASPIYTMSPLPTMEKSWFWIFWPPKIRLFTIKTTNIKGIPGLTSHTRRSPPVLVACSSSVAPQHHPGLLVAYQLVAFKGEEIITPTGTQRHTYTKKIFVYVYIYVYIDISLLLSQTYSQSSYELTPKFHYNTDSHISMMLSETKQRQHVSGLKA